MTLSWAPSGVPSAPNWFPLRAVEHFRGQRITVLEGSGKEGNPYREVTYWLDDMGLLIARRDPTDEADTALSADSFQESKP